jgi:polysaccharide deacetylase 2 family uncharacterized protein YibQ
VVAPGQRSASVPGHRGLVAAYFLVLGLIGGTAAAVFGEFDGDTPHIVEAAAASTPSPAPMQSLPLPVRRVPTGFRTLPAEELAGMVETTTDGLRLPRISPSGWLPWIANARRFDPSGPPARIGLLVINVGANEEAMRRAIEELPAEVSLAFLAGTPDLPRWLALARAHGHESYLMLPIADQGTAERGVRPIEAAVDAAENLRRLRAVLARGEGYAGLVVSSPDRVTQAEDTMRPLVSEIAERGLAVVEVNPAPGSASIQRLTEELGTGYARSTDILDYKLAGDSVSGNLDRLVAWVGESPPDGQPRHAFGVVQPEGEAIDAILAWHRRREASPPLSLVPLIGHFECRDACMARLQVQPAQLRP